MYNQKTAYWDELQNALRQRNTFIGGNNMVSKGWITFQIVQFVFFLCVSVFLFTRTVDGHGTVQTLEVKLISFAVWGIFYLGTLAIEWLAYFVQSEFMKSHIPRRGKKN